MSKVGSKRIVYIGVDEAGRGPIVGDMVVAGVVVTDSVIRELESLGLADSKKLSSQRRRHILEEALTRGVVVVAYYVAPWRIDRENLNLLEAKAIDSILTTLGRILSGEDIGVYVVVDEVKGRRAQVELSARRAFQSRLLGFTMEDEADSKYPPASLASIAAKVLRDVNLEVARRVFGDFGSGYPHDPKTREWIKSEYASRAPRPLIVRASWSSLRDLAPEWYIEKTRRGDGVHKSLLDYAKR
jgi:ribonuclease HII